MCKSYYERYQSWLNSKYLSPEFLLELKHISSDMVENLFYQPFSLKFGTAGIRSKMGAGSNLLNEVTYQQLAHAYARYLKSKKGFTKKVVIGHDNRWNSTKYSLLVAKVLSSYNIPVYLFENNKLIPTPIVSYTIRKLKAAGGIMITASHNPKTDNGFKVYNNNGAQLLPEECNKILSFLVSDDFVVSNLLNDNNKKIKTIDNSIIESYFNEVKQKFNPKYISKNIRILYSSLHGTGTNLTTPFLKSLGYDVIDYEPHNKVDPNFTNALICNPEDIKVFDKNFLDYAVNNNANVIFASDPDADRIAVGILKDDQWFFLNGNQTGIIASHYLIKNSKLINKIPVILSTFVSNNLIDRIALKNNGATIKTPTGFKWIAEIMDLLKPQQHFIAGFEEAIGLLPSTINRDKDSIQAAALIAKIINEYDEKKLDLIDILEKEIFPLYGHWFGKTCSINIAQDNWKFIANQYIDNVSNFNNESICGYKINKKYFDSISDSYVYELENDSWIRFRKSGTEPKLKVYFNLYPINDKLEYDPNYTFDLKNKQEEMMNFIQNNIFNSSNDY